tara:strand:- start:601 stop:924 length:324 start_codon:yes stop_codon:yes gene_type:complete
MSYSTPPRAYPATPDAAITAMGPPELHRSHIDDHSHEIDPIPFNLIEDDNLVEDENLSPLEPELEYSFEAEDPCYENPEPTAREVEAHNANMDQTNAKMEEDHGRPY